MDDYLAERLCRRVEHIGKHLEEICVEIKGIRAALEKLHEVPKAEPEANTNTETYTFSHSDMSVLMGGDE